jgi:hypothetical protein
MSRPKLSLASDDDAHLFDDPSGYLDIAERLAGFFQRPDLAEKIRGSFQRFVSHEDGYDVIPLPLVRELFDALVAIEAASTGYMNGENDLLPAAISQVSAENEDLFEIYENKNGHTIYNGYASLTRARLLRKYFQQALELNKEIEYGNYT